LRAQILKWGLLTIVLAGFAVLLFQYSHRPKEATPFKLVSTRGSVSMPARIKIPGIKVDAAIEQVAVTADGSMDVPKLPLNTAWYKLGPRPGEIGSAVIAGHVNWKNGAKAVFADLRNLKPGDKILVEDTQGAVVSFVVRESRTYDKNVEAKDVFTSNDGKAHLNLVTCIGVWNKTAQSYSQRLVVFADKEMTE